MDLKNKTVVIGVTGGIAAYKIAALVSMLKKAKAHVHVIMTRNACRFIAPLTFETLSGYECLTDTFERKGKFDVEHVELAKKADIFLVAPATANVTAKLANGIADDMLTTTFLASECPKIVAPAMNTRMYKNPVTQDNMKKLEGYGIEVITPATGYLACGDTGAGKMPEPEVLFDYIAKAVFKNKDLAGRKVLVTAGATREAIDPVRFITNHSSGKMGFALARECALRGADVMIVKGAVTEKAPRFCKVIDVESAEDMFSEVSRNFSDADIVIMAAAVADYTPMNYSDDKVKKKGGDMSIQLQRTKDILGTLGKQKKKGQFICGFSMETKDLVENSKDKLKRKNADMIVANNLKDKGAGFCTDTNLVTLISKDFIEPLELMSKEDVAGRIIDKICTDGILK
ncbi:MAG: bifunctional phosphopantothenoylcysteine decarboxylase/phosphopantothenate--cysteine ligase CoaBC [Hornefia sp.]|nr:bifunctional phosphopantothenoylcysteine decarboxylase/phosphopantothenate--cysteine ligase CoaBC [Hornefia sp.]